MSTSVKIENVTKRFGNFVANDHVNLNIEAGDFVSLLGPSGCGKTTLLSMILGVQDITEGKIYFDDTLVSEIPIHKRDVGMVFQNYALFPHMTVLKNVTDAPVRVQRRSRDEVENEARELLAQLGLAEHADKVPCQLSGGQQQRVAIARALCMRPDVIYFDEATSALDPKLTADMRDLIRRLSSQGMAVGIVTHEMGFARDVSDRVAFLYDGSIAEEGSPDQVLANPKTDSVREFLSRAED